MNKKILPTIILAVNLLTAGCATVDVQSEHFLTINNAGNTLRIPLDAMYDARIVASSGLSVFFADGNTLWVDALLVRELEYDLDIREYPAYLLGLRNEEEASDLSADEVNDIRAARDLVLSNASLGIVQFDTARGHGYGALGSDEAFLFLVLPENNRAITQIYITGNQIEDFLDTIIEGTK